MGFRGIDPDGLHELAARALQTTHQPILVTRNSMDILTRHGFSIGAASLAAACSRVVAWGEEVASRLTMRADLIRTGQCSPWSPLALARARFAAEVSLRYECFEDWVASRMRIESTVSEISHWLDQSLRDWDVTNNDLHNIVDALRLLGSDEINQVVTALTPHQLER